MKKNYCTCYGWFSVFNLIEVEGASCNFEEGNADTPEISRDVCKNN